MNVLDLLQALSVMAGYRDNAPVHLHQGSMYCTAPDPAEGGDCDAWVLTDFGWTWVPSMCVWVYPG